MLPGFFWEATEGDDPVGGIAPRWSRASALSFLDDAGIDVAVTSISTPVVYTGDDAAARLLARGLYLVIMFLVSQVWRWQVVSAGGKGAGG